MSFDALTILGLLSVIFCGGFLVALVNRNDASVRSAQHLTGPEKHRPADYRS